MLLHLNIMKNIVELLEPNDIFVLRGMHQNGHIYDDLKSITRVSRVYARAIAGKPLSMQYLASQRLFYLSYYIDTNIGQPTEIFRPSIQYSRSSYDIIENNALKWKVDPTNPNIIRVEPSDQLMKSKGHAVIGVIDVRPKD